MGLTDLFGLVICLLGVLVLAHNGVDSTLILGFVVVLAAVVRVSPAVTATQAFGKVDLFCACAGSFIGVASARTESLGFALIRSAGALAKIWVAAIARPSRLLVVASTRTAASVAAAVVRSILARLHCQLGACTHTLSPRLSPCPRASRA